MLVFESMPSIPSRVSRVSRGWRGWRGWLVAGCVASTSSIAGNAAAQEANDKAAADVLFEQGRDLLKNNNLAAACPKLEESLRLDRGIGTMLYLAECWKRAGKTASAWAQFREAEDLAQKDGDAREKVAKENADQLAPTLSKLTVRVTNRGARDLAISRDGHPLGQALWGIEAPIDPGEHVIGATATGYKPWQTKVVVGAKSDRVVVDVPALERAPEPPPPPPPRIEAPAPNGNMQRVVGASLAGLGAVGIGVGVGFGLSAIAKNDRADSHCTQAGCDPDGITLGDQANQHGTISTIAFAAGAALIVGGAILFFVAPRSPRPKTEAGAGAHRGQPNTGSYMLTSPQGILRW